MAQMGIERIMAPSRDGYNCGATIVRDRRVFAAICEEQTTHKKYSVGCRERSIEYGPRIAGAGRMAMEVEMFDTVVREQRPQ